MADADSQPDAHHGGFLPSPAWSTASTATNTTTTRPGRLPPPRAHPLRPGSAREDTVRGYIDARLLHISRRYVKTFSLPDPADDVAGYSSAAELCRDLDALVDIVWRSGTPSLQVPYLLSVAGDFNERVARFAPRPAATLGLLRKLDHCFASLLAGRDRATGAVLPGFDGDGPAKGMSGTDMVRCRSTVEEARRVVAGVLTGEGEGEATEDLDGPAASGTEGSGWRMGRWEDDEDDELHMDVARVYEHTLVQLGERLGGMHV